MEKTAGNRRVFVMGDVHGAAMALTQCLERSHFNTATDQLIQLGDITDGLPGVYACVEILLGIKNLVCLRGNHDDWFLDFIRTGYHPVGWAYRGEATAKSYLALTDRQLLLRKSHAGWKTALEPADIPLLHRVFFENQLLYYVDASNNCFVHGGFDRFQPLEVQRPEVFCWDRILWTDALTSARAFAVERERYPFYTVAKFREVFIGHTPTLNYGTDQPMHAEFVWNLDTGASYHGRLTIMDIATKKYWQSDPVTELYP